MKRSKRNLSRQTCNDKHEFDVKEEDNLTQSDELQEDIDRLNEIHNSFKDIIKMLD